MTFEFVKMHGAGNDYVYVNGFETTVEDPSAVSISISDRHFGVGADGLVLILPPSSEDADVRMRMFNADGSEAEMCGNAIRCVAKFAHEKGLAECNPVRVETGDGIKVIEKQVNDSGTVSSAKVDMGVPRLKPDEIPVSLEGEQIVDCPIDPIGIAQGEWMTTSGLQPGMTCVSMGNPHVVLFCSDVDAIPLEEVGPVIENAGIFPERINVHFVQVISSAELKMRTWERGSGITLACGTGASAVCVAGVLTGKSDREVLIHLPGGDLTIQWRDKSNHVFMTGPATEVFAGEWFGE